MGSNYSLDQPNTYRIRVQGELGARWEEYFGDMTITEETLAGGRQVTVLSGLLEDQAAVQGVLQKLYNLGFALLSLEKIEPGSL